MFVSTKCLHYYESYLVHRSEEEHVATLMYE